MNPTSCAALLSIVLLFHADADARAQAQTPTHAQAQPQTRAQVQAQEETQTQARAVDVYAQPGVVLLGPPPPRPRLTTLVLSGGGARGAAHIGVLEVLEREGVVPDLIVGTSMGAVVGGLYAAGYSPQEARAILEEVDWGDLFIDRAPRHDRSFRRKDDERIFLLPLQLHFRGFRPYIPPGLLAGQRLELFLESLAMQASSTQDFDSLPIPYRAVTADLDTGEAVVVGRGSLAEAIRASMSVPGTLAPVVVDGRRLVDGGSAANLPIGIAQQFGAARIIAVDISSPGGPGPEEVSFLGVIRHLQNYLTTGNRAVDLAKLRPGDLLIRPDLGDLTFLDFKRMPEAVRIGRDAAEKVVKQIREFAATAADRERFAARHRREDATRLPVTRLEIENGSWVDDRIIEGQLDVPIGEPLDPKKIRQQLSQLYGLEYFGNIHHEYVSEGGGGMLRLHVPRKPHGRNSVRFGISLKSDLDGEASYALTIRHRALALNRRGGEWVNTLQLGSDMGLASEFYQPFDWGMRWFVTPSAGIGRRNRSLWIDGERVAEYRVDTREARLEGGRVFSNWGELRAGLFRGWDEADLRIGPPLIEELEHDEAGFRFGFRVDTQDSPAFPIRGSRVNAEVRLASGSLGAEEDVDEVGLDASKALTFGRETLVFGLTASANYGGTGSIAKATTLGGFLRLSGLGEDELLNERGGVAAIVYYHQITWLDYGAISNRVFVGASLEAGNVYSQDDSITWDSLRYGGSIFVGADTFVGPAYFGWGYTEPDRERLYFVIGQRF